jgi:cell division protein FtsB
MSKKKKLEKRIADLWSDADFFEEKAIALEKENRQLKQENEELKRQIEILKEGISSALTADYWRWCYTYEDELNY